MLDFIKQHPLGTLCLVLLGALIACMVYSVAGIIADIVRSWHR